MTSITGRGRDVGGAGRAMRGRTRVSATVIAGMAGLLVRTLVTCLQYRTIEDTSTKLYRREMPKRPRWLAERHQHVWQAYLHMNPHLSAALEDQLERDAGLS